MKSITWEELNKTEAAAPENDDLANEGEFSRTTRTSEENSEQVLSNNPVKDILQELSSKGLMVASPEEIDALALAITDGLCEKIVPAKYGAPINRRVINWLRGRIRRD